MQEKTAGLTYEERRTQSAAMGRRNRAAFEKARARGAKTWTCEEFRRGDDGVMRVATKRVPVVRDDEGDFKQKFIADDGTTYYDADAVRQFNRQWERGGFGGLRRDVASRRGRAPRAASNTRARGSRRSSARSGDSGEDDGPSDEPPPRRLCAFCGGDIPAGRSPRATHCSDKHADRDRQRRKRQRDRERDLRPRVPTTADFQRMLEITDELSEQLRTRVFCGCNGRHVEFDPGACFRCGHWLPRRGVVA